MTTFKEEVGLESPETHWMDEEEILLDQLNYCALKDKKLLLKEYVKNKIAEHERRLIQCWVKKVPDMVQDLLDTCHQTLNLEMGLTTSQTSDSLDTGEIDQSSAAPDISTSIHMHLTMEALKDSAGFSDCSNVGSPGSSNIGSPDCSNIVTPDCSSVVTPDCSSIASSMLLPPTQAQERVFDPDQPLREAFIENQRERTVLVSQIPPNIHDVQLIKHFLEAGEIEFICKEDKKIWICFKTIDSASAALEKTSIGGKKIAVNPRQDVLQRRLGQRKRRQNAIMLRQEKRRIDDLRTDN